MLCSLHVMMITQQGVGGFDVHVSQNVQRTVASIHRGIETIA